MKKNSKVKEFSKGSYLYQEDETITDIFILLSGHCISYSLTRCGKPCTVTILSAGDFIGEEDFFSGGKSEKFIEVSKNSKCILIPIEEYKEILLNFPSFAYTRIENLSKRLKDTEEMMSEIAYSKLPHRLLLILAKLGKEFGSEEDDSIIFNLEWSHQDIASMIGSTRESVTSTFSSLQKDGALIVDGKMINIVKRELFNYS